MKFICAVSAVFWTPVTKPYVSCRAAYTADALEQDVEAVRARDKVERTAELLRDGVQSRFISVHFNNMRNV